MQHLFDRKSGLQTPPGSVMSLSSRSLNGRESPLGHLEVPVMGIAWRRHDAPHRAKMPDLCGFTKNQRAVMRHDAPLNATFLLRSRSHPRAVFITICWQDLVSRCSYLLLPAEDHLLDDLTHRLALLRGHAPQVPDRLAGEAQRQVGSCIRYSNVYLVTLYIFA
jgi:hypothetical protein